MIRDITVSKFYVRYERRHCILGMTWKFVLPLTRTNKFHKRELLFKRTDAMLMVINYFADACINILGMSSITPFQAPLLNRQR